jgi:hypothetical protein
LTRRRPPRLAEWLLTRAPGPLTDALAGDLAEEFTRGRSRVWYWRQVLAAVAVGVPWPLLLLVAVSAYVFPVPAFNWLLPWRARFYVTLAWPLQLVTADAVGISTYGIIPLVAVAIHLAAARRFRVRAYCAAMLPLFLTLILGEAALTILVNLSPPSPHHYRPAYTAMTCLAFLLTRRAALLRTPEISS